MCVTVNSCSQTEDYHLADDEEGVVYKYQCLKTFSQTTRIRHVTYLNFPKLPGTMKKKVHYQQNLSR